MHLAHSLIYLERFSVEDTTKIGATMRGQKIYYQELLSVGWLIIWRGIILGLLLGWISGWLFTYIVADVLGSEGLRKSTWFVAVWVVNIFLVWPLLIQMLLRKRFNGFSIKLVRADNADD